MPHVSTSSEVIGCVVSHHTPHLRKATFFPTQKTYILTLKPWWYCALSVAVFISERPHAYVTLLLSLLHSFLSYSYAPLVSIFCVL